MTQLTTLLKDLISAQHICRILHWKSSGCHFNSAHEVCGDYVDHFNDDIDAVAEMLITLNNEPVALSDCTNTFDINIDVNTNYEASDIYKNLISIFNAIIKDFTLSYSEEIPEAFKSKLQDMQYYYIIENGYKNVRRLTD